jgi:hypothetical protein
LRLSSGLAKMHTKEETTAAQENACRQEVKLFSFLTIYQRILNSRCFNNDVHAAEVLSFNRTIIFALSILAPRRKSSAILQLNLMVCEKAKPLEFEVTACPPPNSSYSHERQLRLTSW